MKKLKQPFQFGGAYEDPPFGIKLHESELESFYEFKAQHSHPELDDIEEDCAPMGQFTMTLTTSSIGWGWSCECTYCNQSTYLSSGIDF